MDLGPLRALALELSANHHGVDVIVTRPAPDDTPIECKGIWLTTITQDMPVGTDLQRKDPYRVMALRRADVPNVPRGTIIRAPEKSGDAEQDWFVDGYDRLEADHTRVVVVPTEGVS